MVQIIPARRTFGAEFGRAFGGGASEGLEEGLKRAKLKQSEKAENEGALGSYPGYGRLGR